MRHSIPVLLNDGLHLRVGERRDVGAAIRFRNETGINGRGDYCLIMTIIGTSANAASTYDAGFDQCTVAALVVEIFGHAGEAGERFGSQTESRRSQQPHQRR